MLHHARLKVCKLLYGAKYAKNVNELYFGMMSHYMTFDQKIKTFFRDSTKNNSLYFLVDRMFR